MRVLFVTSEVFPFAKTGGLGDVSAALPAALAELGVDIRILMPAYPEALERAPHLEEVARFGIVLGCGGVRLLQTHLPGNRVPVLMVDCPELYNRPGGPYQDEEGKDWADNALRFALLNHVAAEIARDPASRFRPDVLHANDWHAGLAPLLLSQEKGPRPATLFTIHNLAYQGLFEAGCFERLALPRESFHRTEFYGQLSFLKAGIQAADWITTVSPTYAGEILTPEYGCGLEGVLRERAGDLTGILNGADYGLWDPSLDPALTRNYTSRGFAAKAVCKSAIQAELGLAADADAPLLAFMSRLAHQKMPDVVLQALPALLAQGAQFALVGEGDRAYETGFRDIALQYPGRVAVRIGYDEPVARRLIAGADMLLHPSRFEPCGLVPIYAMRYGAVPIVRKSGGMTDTVSDATSEALKDGEASGFCFESATSDELIACVARAIALYKQPIPWRKLQRTAMSQDFSWRKSAERYAALYASLSQATPSESVSAKVFA
jgi:starch synthase